MKPKRKLVSQEKIVLGREIRDRLERFAKSVKIGGKIKIKVLREYGPYMDKRPNIPQGTICTAVIFGIKKEKTPTTYLVTYQRRKYHIQPQDAEIQNDEELKEELLQAIERLEG